MMRSAFSLFAILTLALFAFLFGNEADEIYPGDLAFLLVLLGLILAVQIAGLAVLRAIVKRVAGDRTALIAIRIAAAILLIGNAYFCVFITFEASLLVRRLLSVAAGLVLLALLFRRSWQPPARFVAVSYILLSFCLYGYTRLTMGSPSKPAIAETVRFTPQRNLYVIGNESLGSPKAFRDLYGLRNLPHVAYLNTHGFRVLDHAYAAADSTMRNYSRLFAFANDLTERDINNRVAFTAYNTAFNTFAANGYKTQFIYHSNYFGAAPPSTDYVFPKGGFGHCAFLQRRFFYVMCHKPFTAWVNRYIYRATPISPALVKSRIDQAARGPEKWVTFYHHAFPYHTASDHSFRDTEYTRKFKAGIVAALPRVRAENFETTIGHILARDPGAVIVTLGDHGAHTLRGAEFGEAHPGVTDGQILEDDYGVLLAVYPANFCRRRISEGTATTYLFEQIAKCMAGDDAPTPAEIVRNRTFYPGKRSNLAAFGVR